MILFFIFRTGIGRVVETIFPEKIIYLDCDRTAMTGYKVFFQTFL